MNIVDICKEVVRLRYDTQVEEYQQIYMDIIDDKIKVFKSYLLKKPEGDFKYDYEIVKKAFYNMKNELPITEDHLTNCYNLLLDSIVNDNTVVCFKPGIIKDISLQYRDCYVLDSFSFTGINTILNTNFRTEMIEDYDIIGKELFYILRNYLFSMKDEKERDLLVIYTAFFSKLSEEEITLQIFKSCHKDLFKNAWNNFSYYVIPFDEIRYENIFMNS